MFSCVFVTFSRGILGQVWYLIVSIIDFAFLVYLLCSVEKKYNLEARSQLATVFNKLTRSRLQNIPCIPMSRSNQAQ